MGGKRVPLIRKSLDVEVPSVRVLMTITEEQVRARQKHKPHTLQHEAMHELVLDRAVTALEHPRTVTELREILQAVLTAQRAAITAR